MQDGSARVAGAGAVSHKYPDHRISPVFVILNEVKNPSGAPVREILRFAQNDNPSKKGFLKNLSKSLAACH